MGIGRTGWMTPCLADVGKSSRAFPTGACSKVVSPKRNTRSVLAPRAPGRLSRSRSGTRLGGSAAKLGTTESSSPLGPRRSPTMSRPARACHGPHLERVCAQRQTRDAQPLRPAGRCGSWSMPRCASPLLAARPIRWSIVRSDPRGKKSCRPRRSRADRRSLPDGVEARRLHCRQVHAKIDESEARRTPTGCTGYGPPCSPATRRAGRTCRHTRHLPTCTTPPIASGARP